MATPPAAAATLGVWGERTASVDWCEPNYVHTPYVAEFFNTMSSVPIVLCALGGLAVALRYGYRRRFVLPIVLMGVVGVGSMAFHGTLLFEGQALDELPMIYAVTALMYSVVETEPTLRFGWKLPAAMLAYCALFTLAYFRLQDYFIYFVVTYIGAVILLFTWAMALYSRVGAVDGSARHLAFVAITLYASGFLFLWLPDKFYCEKVQHLHFHAWFHLLSTAGPWCMIVFLVHTHYALAHAADKGTTAPRKRKGGADSSAVAITVGPEPKPEVRFVGGPLPWPYVSLDRVVKGRKE
jgi:dihydroceramidase